MRSEYHTISCELQALAKKVQDEFGNKSCEDVVVPDSCNFNVLFERGRFYDEYSTRRNERLKRKKGIMMDEAKAKPSHTVDVTFDTGKKTNSRKIGSLRTYVSANYSVSETPRYMLRSMAKENKKPPPSVKFDKFVVAGEKMDQKG